MTAPVGAITSEEEAHGKEKQGDEAPEEIEEDRSNQDAPPESILIAAGDFLGGASARRPRNMWRVAEHADTPLSDPSPRQQGLPAAKRRPLSFQAK
jgi:hypothetical protein